MAFDFTPQFTHGPLSSEFSNADFIEALNNEYNNNADEWNTRLPEPYKPNSSTAASLWSAGTTAATWFFLQLPDFGGSIAGDSPSNPFPVPFNPKQKKEFLSILGSSCEPKDMLSGWKSNRGILPAFENTYYNFANEDTAFSWQDGCLCITDRYNFEGSGDFGGASAATAIVGAVLAFPGTAFAVVRGMLNGMAGPLFGENEEDDPFTAWRRGDPQIGSVRPLNLKNCFCPEDLDDEGNPLICSSNNELYRCALRTGKIPYSPGNACFTGQPCVEVGQAQPSPILGFPSYAPVVMEISNNPGTWLFGGGGDYPSPFTSFSQQLVNANNFLGPYAMFGGMPGRMIIIPRGVYAGELGFVCQNWYDFNDGIHAKDADGNLYPSKGSWWETCLKSRISVRFLPLSSRPLVNVMVATKSFSDNNSPEVYSTNIALATANIGSLLLPQLIASAASSALLGLI
jgi:hypothetical protein